MIDGKGKENTARCGWYVDCNRRGRVGDISFSHLPRLRDRMQRLADSPADSALAESGLRSACRRLMRLEGSLARM